MKVQQEQHEQNRGSGMVISNSREFDDRLMLKILQPKASDCEYRAYLASLYGLSNQIKERFPLLTLTLLPASEKVLAYIKGDLIPRKELQDYGKTAAIKHGKTFPIFALLPMDYRQKGIIVFDACNRINKENIEIKYLHMNKGNELCTHKPVDIIPENAVLDVLQSAWHLYTEYKKYERTGRFDLICYPHGGNPNER